MFSYLAHADSIPWKPGPYPGVELKILHHHPETGGLVVLRKFASGITVPAHIHPLANEWAWVLSGEWIESGVRYCPGTLFFAGKGTPHGPHQAQGDVLSLTVFDGPLTVLPLEVEPPKA
jgi:quercetin dioxygenase-like cupin family protein